MPPFDLISPLTFFYFITLHADRLSFQMGGMTFRINNLIAFLLLSLVIVRFRKIPFSFNRAFFGTILGISFSLFLSFLFSEYKSRALLFLIWWVITVSGYLLLPYILMHILGVKRLITLYFSSFLIVGLYGLFQFLLSCIGIANSDAQFVIPGKMIRVNAFAYEPSYYVLYMTPFVMLVNMYYILKERDSFYPFKRLQIGHLLFINTLFLLSFSTSALFAFFAFAILVAIFSFSYLKKYIGSFVRFFFLYGGSFLVLMFIFSMAATNFFLKFFYYGFMGHHSFSERWFGIINGWTLFKLHPIVGVGAGTYPLIMFDKFLVGDERFHFFLNEGKETLHEWVKFFEPSNVLMELMASLGSVGLLAFALFIIFFFIRFHTLWQSVANQSQKQKALAFFFSALLLLIVLQFNQGLFRTYVWSHLSLCWAYFDTISGERPSCTWEQDSANSWA